MSPRPQNMLHLPNLWVQGFRAIADLSISRLGRVTLIAGKNGVGKTTLLDAVRIYAARGKSSVLVNILQNREEIISIVDADGDKMLVSDYRALFHGRYATMDSHISIGPEEPEKQLSIRYGLTEVDGEEEERLTIEFKNTTQAIPISAFFRESRFSFRAFRDDESERPDFRCLTLGPSLPTNDDIARYWDRVALTDDEDRAIQALRLIYNGEVDRIAVVGPDDDARPRMRSGRRAVVRINGQERPVPLKSLGDGAARIFGVALALANSQDGFLLIDEAENGIHHSVQRDFWNMVMQTAHENNVQVLATTHGWDCVTGFAQAATESEEVEGVLVRLERKDDQIRAVEYSEKELIIAADQDIEVR